LNLDPENKMECIISAISSKDTRANIKLERLRNKKNSFNDAQISLKEEFSGAQDGADTSEVKGNPLYKELIRHEKELHNAYCQAIKYLAKTNEKDSALNAQNLLEEMISRTGVSSLIHEDSLENLEENSTDHLLVKFLRGDDLSVSPEKKNISSFVQPPTRKMFHDVLHAWANSKVRRKGFIAEALLVRMTELSLKYPTFFDVMPDSKAFALAVKCHAGTTHKSKLKHIIELQKAHDAFADHCIPNVSIDDPYFLIFCIKSLHRYEQSIESKLSDAWLIRLHDSLMKRLERSKTTDSHTKGKGIISPAIKQVDVTGAYVSVIRGLVNCRVKDATKKSLHILENMNKIATLTKTCPTVHIEIKASAYDLILRSLRNDRTKESAKQSIVLLNLMLDYSQCANDGKIPKPSAQSFELCIQCLAANPDSEWVFDKSKNLINAYENLFKSNQCEPSIAVYNSLIQVYAITFKNTSDILSQTLKIFERMKKLAEVFPVLKPDSDTICNIIFACSIAPNDEASDINPLEIARSMYSQLVDDSIKYEITDRCIYNMMRCTLNHGKNVELENEEKDIEEKIVELFQESCKHGLVSYDILNCFKSAVSTEQYTAIVGRGRLANNWIKNVTSKKALYTDGSMGGAGKNSRRKGKSSTFWKKKK